MNNKRYEIKNMCYFSVIIPVYNVERWLAQCLDSVLSQDFTDYEIIIIDDCSPDESYKIYEAYAKKHNCIRVIKHEVNRCQGAARNTGLRAAKGKWIVFLDSDDLMAEGTLQFYYDKIQNTKVESVFSAWFDIITLQGKIISDGVTKTLSEDKKTITLSDNTRALLAGVVYKCYLKKFLFDNDLFFDEGEYYEDYGFNAKLLTTCSECVIYNRVVMHYRVNPLSTTRIKSYLHSYCYYIQSRKAHRLYLQNSRYASVGIYLIGDCISRLLKEPFHQVVYFFPIINKMIKAQYEYDKFSEKHSFLSVFYFLPETLGALIALILVLLVKPVLSIIRIVKRFFKEQP